MVTANGVFDLVDARNEHADEDEVDDHQDDETSDEFEGTEDGADLHPDSVEETGFLAGAFSCQALTSDKCALFAYQ